MNEQLAPLTRRQFAALTLILLIASFVRFYRIGNPSLWSDELWSIEMAMGHGSVHDAFPEGIIRSDQPVSTSLATAAPWWQIWTHVKDVTHPPLYYIVLRGWMALFGSGPAATRSLSAILSIAAIALFFDVCRLLHGPRTALLASGIMALAIGQIDIAQESRSYALLILEEIACCNLLIRITNFGADRRRLSLLIFLLIAMFLTHYLSAGVLLALAVAAMILLRNRDRQKTIAAFIVAGAIILAVWGYEFRLQMQTLPFSDPTYFHEIFPHHLANTFLRTIRLPLQYIFGEDLVLRLPLWPHIIAAVAILMLIFRARRRRDLFLWILLGVATIAFVAAIDLAHNTTLLQFSRYTLLAGPPLFVIVATIHWPRNLGPRNLVPLVVITSLAIFVTLRICRPSPPRQDFQQLADIIDSNAMPDELLVFYNQSEWLSPGTWYMGYKYYSPASDHPWLTLRHSPSPELLHELRQRQTLWLIGRTPEIYGPILFPGWRPAHLWLTSAGGICLLRNTNTDSVR